MKKPALMIAAPSSGSGKSTLSIGLMSAFSDRMQVQPFKTGPDYIDPMYHSCACRRPSINLDSWILSEEQIHQIWTKYAVDAELCLVEGVMGMFDSWDSNDPLLGSTAGLACSLGLPIVLVVNCAKASASIAALVHGFDSWKEGINISAIICNNVASSRHEYLLQGALRQLGIPIAGYIPRIQELAIKERHLGLRTSYEWQDELGDYLKNLKKLCCESLDLNLLLEIAQKSKEIFCTVPENKYVPTRKTRLAIAHDKAFCFYYEDNLRLLQEHGVELIDFSPLNDKRLPENIDGVFLGGGYPELFAQRLSDNASMKESIRKFAENDGLIYAECGGLVYLSHSVLDDAGSDHLMCNVIPPKIIMGKQVDLGYKEMTAISDNWLIDPGMKSRTHEFHYASELPEQNPKRLFETLAVNHPLPRTDGYGYKRVITTWQHLMFRQDMRLVENFVQALANSAQF